ncbi:MAG: hypothetical protein IT440_13300 [Phycisphaeraceae bacterium]|nr:hypothetical protein [Phycisphaeraceae bacterium]
MRHTLAMGMVWTGLAVLAANAAAADPMLNPVDQGVGDLDALSTSLRSAERGLRIDGEQTSLFALPYGSAITQDTSVQARTAYLRLAPGFAAKVDRMEYLVRQGEEDLGTNVAPRHDGEFVEVIPANTVFILDPAAQLPHAAAAEPTPSAPNQLVAMPVNAQVDNRVEGRLSTKLDNKVTAKPGVSRTSNLNPAAAGWYTPAPLQVRKLPLKSISGKTPLDAAKQPWTVDQTAQAAIAAAEHVGKSTAPASQAVTSTAREH